MSGKILVTGFERFGYLRRPNKSSEVALPAVRERYGDMVETLLLPVTHDKASEQLLEAIEAIDPAAVAMFGISAGNKVRLEQQAKNQRFNVLFADNEGVRSIGRIDKQGADVYASTLPLEDIHSRLQERGVPTRMSRDAGMFVCNEAMYRALQHNSRKQEDSSPPTGFIHFGKSLNDQFTEEAAVTIVGELIQQNQLPPR